MFDHTADVGLRVTGADLDEVFRTAAEGLFDFIVANRDAVQPRSVATIALAAENGPELLVAWLNELIFCCETRHSLYSRFEVSVRTAPWALTATMAGEPIDRDRHVLDHEVKAATHHGATLAATAAGWTAEVILDI